MSRIAEALQRAASGDSPAPAPGAQSAREGQDRPAQDHPAVEVLLTGVPRPADRHLAPVRGLDPSLAGKFVVTAAVPPASVEQYRRLAATLHHEQVDRGIKTVMVTSAMPGDGKTLTASNLALTLSESYRRRVLLIDADLRRPMMHHHFRIPNTSGLNDGLKAPTDQKLIVVQVSRQLSVLTAGRPDPDPMSGLTSHRMKRVLREAASLFDWVVVDTPPVGLLPDANLLAAMVDAILLVIGAGATRLKPITRAIEALGRDRIIGVVLNRADDREVAAGYGYYGYYGSPRGHRPAREGRGESPAGLES